MLYEYISLIFGILKLVLYKMFYPTRVKFKSLPKMNCNFKIAIKKHSKLLIGKNLRTRNNISFRIYDSGIVSIGSNCFFNDGCSINCQDNINIGDNVIFGQNVMVFDHDHDYKNDINNFITKEVKIGNNVWIGANVTILKGVTIGDDVVIAAGSVIREDIQNNTLVYQQNKLQSKIIKKYVVNEKI